MVCPPREWPEGHCHTLWALSADSTSSALTVDRLCGSALTAMVSLPWPTGCLALRTQACDRGKHCLWSVFHSKDRRKKRDFSPQVFIWKIWNLQKSYKNSTMSICPSSSPTKCSYLTTFIFSLPLSPLSLLLSYVFIHFNFFCRTVWILVAEIIIVVQLAQSCPTLLWPHGL